MADSSVESGAEPVGMDSSHADGYTTVKPRYKRLWESSTESYSESAAPLHNNGAHKVLIKPIEPGKSLNRINPIKIANEIN